MANTRRSLWMAALFLPMLIDSSSAAERVVLAASGRVEPVSGERQLRFEVQGLVARIAVTEGQLVKKGEILAELQNDEGKARCALGSAELERAEARLARIENGAGKEEKAIADARLAQARQELDKLKNGARREEKDQAEARLRRREAERRMAERLVKRLQKLREGDVKAATLEEFENAEDRLTITQAAEAEAKAHLDIVSVPARDEDIKIAEAKLTVEKNRARMVKGKARDEDLLAAKAEVSAAKTRLEIAEARLKKTIMRSPIEGVVLEIFTREGEHSAASMKHPVMTVGDTSKLVVRTEVDENDVSKVREGQRVYARANAFGKTRFTGKVKTAGLVMGRKRLFSDSPRERLDTKVLEVVVELDEKPDLPIGFRMDVYFFEN